MKHVKTFLVFQAINVAIATGVFCWIPAFKKYFTAEDSLVENLSAALFLASFLLGLWLLNKKKGGKALPILISALGLIGFLDEVSFGRRILGFSAPVIGGQEIDAVHDLLRVAPTGAKGLAATHPPVAFLAAAVAAVGAWASSRWWLEGVVDLPRMARHPPYILLFAFAALTGFAILVDRAEGQSKQMVLFEQISEMNAAMALVLACLSIAAGADPAEAFPSPHGPGRKNGEPRGFSAIPEAERAPLDGAPEIPPAEASLERAESGDGGVGRFRWGWLVPTFFYLQGFTLLAGGAVCRWLPAYTPYVLAEDSLVENISAAFFLLSFFLAAWLIRKGRGPKAFLALTAALALLAFLEEVSFGMRTLGFTPPVYRGERIDAVHDFVRVGFVAAGDLAVRRPAAARILLGSVAALVLGLAFFGPKYSSRFLRTFQEPHWILWHFCVALILFSTWIDSAIENFERFAVMEEIFEMNAALGLFFSCLILWAGPPGPAGSPGPLQRANRGRGREPGAESRPSAWRSDAGP